MKSVQGDSGHAQLKMVSDIYSHIIDEDRCKNAQNFETAFYTGQSVAPASSEKGESNTEKLLRILAEAPELADKLLHGLGTLAM